MRGRVSGAAGIGYRDDARRAALFRPLGSAYPVPPMSDTPDPRYLAGIDRFNHGEYFDAHEVWEELWGDCPAADRRFYQALIQAAVSLYHRGRGNRAGADRLFTSGRAYMEPYRPACHGLAVDAFWGQIEAALADPPGPAPRIALDPPPGDPQ